MTQKLTSDVTISNLSRRANRFVGILDDRFNSIEIEKSVADSLAKSEYFDRADSFLNSVEDAIQDPEIKLLQPQAAVVLVIDMNLPEIGDITRFGVDQKSIKTRDAGVTLLEKVIRKKEFLFSEIPVIIVSEYPFEKEILRRVKNVQNKNPAPVILFNKGSSDRRLIFENHLQKCFEYSENLRKEQVFEFHFESKKSYTLREEADFPGVDIFNSLARWWELTSKESAALLGFKHGSEDVLLDILNKNLAQNSVDFDDRVKILIEIRILLGSLFLNKEQELNWLRNGRIQDLCDSSPIEYMLGRKMEALQRMLVEVRFMCGAEAGA